MSALFKFVQSKMNKDKTASVKTTSIKSNVSSKYQIRPRSGRVPTIPAKVIYAAIIFAT
ncbi:unnamed protein product [Umbelopsis vinacea]